MLFGLPTKCNTQTHGLPYARTEQQGINNPFCVLYLPFSQTVTQEISVGKTSSHTVTAYYVGLGTSDGRKSAYINGSTGYITVSDSSDFDIGAADFSFTIDVNFSSVNTAGHDIIINKWNVDFSFFISIVYGNIFHFQAYDGSSHHVLQRSWSPTLGVWYRLAVVRHGNNTALFVDGKQLGSPMSAIYSINTTNNLVYIGRSATGNDMMGYLSNLTIHKGLGKVFL